MTDSEKVKLITLQNDIKNINLAFNYGWRTKQECDKKKKEIQQEINFLLSKGD